MCFVIALLLLLNIPYEQYMAQVNPVFNHLLGYVTVALAIPLAAMRYDDLPLKASGGHLRLCQYQCGRTADGTGLSITFV